MDKTFNRSYNLSISTARSEWNSSRVAFIQFKIMANIFIEPSLIFMNSWSKSLVEINFPKFNIRTLFEQMLNIRYNPCIIVSFWRSSKDPVCTILFRISSEVLQSKIQINKIHQSCKYYLLVFLLFLA